MYAERARRLYQSVPLAALRVLSGDIAPPRMSLYDAASGPGAMKIRAPEQKLIYVRSLGLRLVRSQSLHQR